MYFHLKCVNLFIILLLISLGLYDFHHVQTVEGNVCVFIFIKPLFNFFIFYSEEIHGAQTYVLTWEGKPISPKTVLIIIVDRLYQQ